MFFARCHANTGLRSLCATAIALRRGRARAGKPAIALRMARLTELFRRRWVEASWAAGGAAAPHLDVDTRVAVGGCRAGAPAAAFRIAGEAFTRLQIGADRAGIDAHAVEPGPRAAVAVARARPTAGKDTLVIAVPAAPVILKSARRARGNANAIMFHIGA